MNKRKGPTPFGYHKEAGQLIPDPHKLSKLHEVDSWLKDGSVSLRNAADYISSETGQRISHEGLKRRLKNGVYLQEGESLLSMITE